MIWSLYSKYTAVALSVITAGGYFLTLIPIPIIEIKQNKKYIELSDYLFINSVMLVSCIFCIFQAFSSLKIFILTVAFFTVTLPCFFCVKRLNYFACEQEESVSDRQYILLQIDKIFPFVNERGKRFLSDFKLFINSLPDGQLKENERILLNSFYERFFFILLETPDLKSAYMSI